MVVACELRRAVSGYVGGLCALHCQRLIVIDGGSIIALDARGAVAFDDAVEVALGVNEYLLAAGEVVEREFVEAVAARGAMGADAAACLLDWQVECCGMGSVVDGAQDDRAVGVAFVEANDDFHPYARDELRSPPRSAPRVHG